MVDNLGVGGAGRSSRLPGQEGWELGYSLRSHNPNTRLSRVLQDDIYGGLSRSPGDSPLLFPSRTYIPATRGWWLPAQSTRQESQLSSTVGPGHRLAGLSPDFSAQPGSLEPNM